MDQAAKGPDPIVNSDRVTGSTPPVSGQESSNVVGRPPGEKPETAFHEPAEKPSSEKKSVTQSAALSEGASFDSVAPLQDVDPK